MKKASDINQQARKKPPDINIELLGVYSLLFFQEIPSLIYFSSLLNVNKERAEKILSSLINSEPPFLIKDTNPENLRWFVNCISREIGITLNDYDPLLLYLNILTNHKSNTNLHVYKIIKNQQYSAERMANDCMTLINFANENHALFEALKKYINGSFPKQFADKLIEKYQLLPLLIFDDNTINNIDIVNYLQKNPKEIYGLPCAYTCDQFGKNFQILKTSSAIFPNIPTYLENNLELSVLNTSLLSQKHFTDLIMKTTTTLFMSDKFEQAMQSAKVYDDLGDWIFIAILSRRFRDPSFVNRVTPYLINKTNKNTICYDFIERLINDDFFLNDLKQTTGSYADTNLFLTQSIPFIYRRFLINLNFEPFAQLSSLKLFVISDKDRNIDNTFICGYFLIFYVLKAADASENAFGDISQKINDMLSRIRNEDLRDKIIIDAFSLILIKTKSNNPRFIFSSETACIIISELSSFATDKKIIDILKKSIKKIQIAQSISNKNQIEEALAPIQSIVNNALVQDDVEIAQRVALYNPDILKFVTIFKNMQLYLKSHNSYSYMENSDQEENARTLLEISLTFHDDIEVFDRVKELASKLQEQYHALPDSIVLFQKRRNLIGHNPLKCIKKCNSQRVKDFKKVLSNTSALKWEKIKKFTEKTPLFSGFIRYLNSIIPVLFETEFANNVLNAFSVSHNDIITQLLKSKKFEVAEKIAKSFNTSIVDYVLSDPGIDRSYIKEILDPYPIVTIADMLTTYKSKPPNASKAIQKYYDLMQYKKKLTETNDENKTIDDYDDSKQEGCTKDFLSNALRTNLSSESINFDQVLDISYRIPSEDFISILEPMLAKITTESLVKISKISICFGCDSIIDQKINLLARIHEKYSINPFPLKHTFSLLLSKRDVKLAIEFISFYKYEVDSISLIRKELLNSLHNNLPFKELFDIIPEAKNQIIESLPTRYHSSFNDTFSTEEEVFPDNWRKGSDTITTILNNFSDHENVVKYLTEHESIDFDLEFHHILVKKSFMQSKITINGNDDSLTQFILAFTSFIETFHSVFRSPERVIQQTCKQLFSYVNMMDVHDIESEIVTVKNIGLIVSVFNECIKLINSTDSKTHFSISLNEVYSNTVCLSNFAKINPYSRYKIEYSFKDFGDKATGQIFLSYCYQIDNLDLANQFSQVWHLKDFENREKYAVICFLLGKYEAGMQYAPNRRRSTSSTSAHQSEALSKKLVALFSHQFMYESELIASLSETFDIAPLVWEFTENGSPESIIQNEPIIEQNAHIRLETQKQKERISKIDLRKVARASSRVSFSTIPNMNVKEYSIPTVLPNCDYSIPHFYKRILAISNSEIAYSPSPESMKILRHFLRTNSKIGDQVSYFVSCGNFEKAFKYMEKQPTPQAKWNLFFDSIVFTAYSYNNEARMKFRIFNIDPELKTYGSYLEKLLSFSLKNNMPHLQLDLEMILERTETAAITAIKLSTEAKTVKESLSFLETASTALNLELSGKKKLSTIENTLSKEKLRQLCEDVNYQIKFYQYCIESDLFENPMSLFMGESVAESMVVYLFREFQFNLAIEIEIHCGLSIKSISQKLVDVLINEDRSFIKNFIEELTKFAPLTFFEKMVNSILMRTYYLFHDESLVLDIISSCIYDPEYQCKLMIQFLQIEDAFKLAKNNNLISLLPLIGHIAQKHNLLDIVNDANKILSKASQ